MINRNKCIIFEPTNKTNVMKYIKRILGITELIKKQEETNKLLSEIIKLQKHKINNDCIPYSQRNKVW